MKIEPSSTVKILAGPYAGFNGTVQSLKNDFAVIRLSVLGLAQQESMSLENLKLVNGVKKAKKSTASSSIKCTVFDHPPVSSRVSRNVRRR